MPAKYSTGALIAAGLVGWLVGLGMGGRVMAQYCSEQGMMTERNQRRRRMYARGGR